MEALVFCVLLVCVQSAVLPEDPGSGCTESPIDIDVGNGSLRSPSYPDMYPANNTCKWRLTAPSGELINLTSVFFSVEYSHGCLFDHVAVYDGNTESGEALGKYCGNTEFTLVTSSNQALVVFTADVSYEGKGFQLAFSRATGSEPTPRIRHDPMCNTTLTSAPGYLISPNYPLPSDSNTYCTYKITAPEDKVVELIFSYFSLELSRDCQYDSVGVYDGPDTGSDKLDSFCGDGRPPSIRSTGRDLFLTYTTDESFTKSGFNVTFVFIDSTATLLRVKQGDKDCSRLVEGAGVLTSPGYPSLYPNNKVCVFKIQAPPGQYVKIVFEEFRLEESDDCAWDFLDIYDEENEDFPIGHYCGQQVFSNTSMTSMKNKMILRFTSDMSLSDSGFVIRYSSVSQPDTVRCYRRCEHGGQCVQQSAGPVCDCPPPYSGPLCEQTPAGCGEQPCLNGGTCKQWPDVFQCFCLKGYNGVYCEERGEGDKLWFTHAPQNHTNMPLNSAIVLQCQTNRPDQIEMRWLFNDYTDLSSNELISRQMRVEIHDGGVLEIPSLTQANSGKYTCQAYDGLDSVVQDAYVTTDEPCLLEFTNEPQDTAERAGKKAHLFQCKATGGLAYRWEKEGVPIEEDQRVQTLVNNYLQVSHLEPSDSGKYTCIVQGQNCVMRKSALLTVIGTQVIDSCGQPRFALPGGIQIGARISRGKKALEGSYPWFVLLLNTTTGKSFCGASIIDDRWLVTAAHCVTHALFGGPTTKLIAGTTSCTGKGGVQLSVEKVIIHPKYASKTYRNDIALIKVRETISFTARIMPICLQPLSFLETNFFRTQASGFVAGCGKLTEFGAQPGDLQEVKLPIQGEHTCKKHAPQNYVGVVDDTMMCAGYRKPNRGDACTGDSGGGFVVKSDDRYNSSSQYTLAGIVSWGQGCDAKDTYGYYANAGRYFQWIHETIKK